MKVALTIWDNRISPVFDVCREVLILAIEGGQVMSTRQEDIASATGQGRVDRLAALGIETLVCGAISEPLHRELVSRGIRVLGFVAGEIDMVVQALLSGRLPDPTFAMPGCRGKQHRFRGGRDHFSGRGRGRGRRSG